MKKILCILLFIPFALFGQDGISYSPNKISILVGGNVFSENTFNNLGFSSSLIYVTGLHKKVRFTRELLFSFNTPKEDFYNGSMKRLGLLIGPSLKLKENLPGIFLRVGYIRDKLDLKLDGSNLFFGDHIDPNYGLIFQTNIDNNPRSVDDFVVFNVGFDGTHNLNQKINLEYSLGYIFTNEREYDYYSEAQDLSPINFTLGISYNLSETKNLIRSF